MQVANDIKVLLDSLNIDSAFVQGQSDGAILALLLAINYPQKIAKLATYGANIFPGKQAIFDEIDDLVCDTLKFTKSFTTKRPYSQIAYQPNITEKDLVKLNALYSLCLATETLSSLNIQSKYLTTYRSLIRL